MLIKKIGILGGTGFVGKSLANRLTRDDYELRVLTRHRVQSHNSLMLLPTLELVECNIHEQAQLERAPCRLRCSRQPSGYTE